MEFKGLKINIIILVAIIVIIAFFTGKHLLEMYNVDKPLKEELLSINGVKDDLILVDNNNKTDIIISFKTGINFYQVYKEVEKTSLEMLGKSFGKIIIKNDSNKKLDDAYYKMHFTIYEGLATNKFTIMEEEFREIAESSKLKNYKIWVDNHAIYLQLSDGISHLYKRIERKDNILFIRTEGGENSG